MLQDIIYAIAEKLQKKCKLVLFFTIIALLFAFYVASNIKIDNSISALLPTSSQELAKTVEILDIPPSSRTLLIELRVNDKAIMPKLMEAAHKIKEETAALMVNKNPQITLTPEKLLDLLPAMTNEAVLYDLISKTQNMDKAFEGIRERLAGNYGFIPKDFIKTDPLSFIAVIFKDYSIDGTDTAWFNQFSFSEDEFSISQDGLRLLIVLRPKASMQDAVASRALMEAMHKAVLKNIPDGTSYEFVGSYCYTATNANVIERDLKLTVTLSLVFIAIIYFFSVRAWPGIWLLLTPVASMMLTGTIMGLIWPAVSGLALGFGAAVLGLAEDYAVLVYFALKKGKESPARIVSVLARPMLFSSILCMASFCILLFSSIPALQQLGFFAASSLLFGLIIAIFILPCCPGVIKSASHIKNAPQAEDCNNKWHSQIKILKPKKMLISILWVILLVFCFFANAIVDFNPSLKSMGADTEEMQLAAHSLAERWNFAGEPQILASSAKTFDEALQEATILEEKLHRFYPDMNFLSLTKFISPRNIQEDNLQNWKKFQTQYAGWIVEELKTKSPYYGFSQNAFTPFTTWLTSDSGKGSLNTPQKLEASGLSFMLWAMYSEKNGQHYILTILPPKGNPGYMDITLEAFLKDPRQAGLGKNNTLLASDKLSAELVQGFANERHLFLWASIVCIILLFICFRRPILVMSACLPPLFGLAAVFLWLLISGTPLSLAGLCATVLLVGLGADYGIVMLHEIAHNKGIGAYKSIFVSSLTTLAGIGILILAKHPVLHELGGVIFFGLLAEMLAVLLFVPRLMQHEA